MPTSFTVVPVEAQGEQRGAAERDGQHREDGDEEDEREQRSAHCQQYHTNRDSVIPIHKMIRELKRQGVVSKTRLPFNNLIWPGQTKNGKQLYGAPHDELLKPLKDKVDQVKLQISESSSWPWTLPNERSGQGFTSMLTHG
ncbi:hypothetical protein WISP_75205 [Willisornis vidua]|uniref:Uncharacterized protein n=1 Tax=Willisornis vidua TaxID=1566151 RepID=A0ABQ9DBL8_9PASS|nr:hypothetical protein WISP_75205 [Willisornis vidua]